MFEINPDLKVQVKKTTDITWESTGDGEVTFIPDKVEKTYFIIDDFYKDPDKVREYTLKELKDKTNVYTDKKGDRPDDGRLAGAIGRRVWDESPETMKEMEVQMSPVFEQLCKSKEWHLEFDEKHHYDKWSSMRFVINVTNHEEVVRSERPWYTVCHVDGPYNKWASLVYLNTAEEYGEEESIPGTGLYSVVPPNSDGTINHPKLQAIVPVRYNRCMVYDANQVHGAILEPELYHNYDRLTQIMFF
jgi:hypothetical protein